jgi:hypothetical protein
MMHGLTNLEFKNTIMSYWTLEIKLHEFLISVPD